MKTNYIILIIIVILVIFGVGLLISFNNDQNLQNETIKNYSQSNSSENNSSDINSNTNETINSNAIDTSINSKDNSKSNSNNNSNKNGFNQSSEFTALEAMETVENLPHEPTEPEVTVVKPRYKSEIGWLVPLRDKKTGQFAGSIYVYDKGGPFAQGPQTYKDYKEVVSKKK